MTALLQGNLLEPATELLILMRAAMIFEASNVIWYSVNSGFIPALLSGLILLGLMKNGEVLLEQNLR